MRYRVALFGLMAAVAAAETPAPNSAPNLTQKLEADPTKAYPLAQLYLRGSFARDVKHHAVDMAESKRLPVKTAPGVVGVDIEWETLSAYLSFYQTGYMFDTHTQRRITWRQLLHPDSHDDFFKALTVKRNKAAALVLKTTELEGEDREWQRRSYDECHQSPYRYLPQDLLIYRDRVATRVGWCMIHAIKAFDDLRGTELAFTFAELKPWLSAYGRCRLIEQREQCSQPVGLEPGVYRGTLGKQRITLVFGGMQTQYYYDRHERFIPLDVKHPSADTLVMEETYFENDDFVTHTFTLRHVGAGRLRGYWQGAGGEKQRFAVDVVLQSAE